VPLFEQIARRLGELHRKQLERGRRPAPVGVAGGQSGCLLGQVVQHVKADVALWSSAC
jgi:hypothetical protein